MKPGSMSRITQGTRPVGALVLAVISSETRVSVEMLRAPEGAPLFQDMAPGTRPHHRCPAYQYVRCIQEADEDGEHPGDHVDPSGTTWRPPVRAAIAGPDELDRLAEPY
jgi:hypothetical protein